MNDEDKYWDDLISDLDNPELKIDKNPEEKLREFDDTYQWTIDLKNRLKTVFAWDSFDKNEARLRLHDRLRKKDRRLAGLSRKVWIRAAVILIAILSGFFLHFLMPAPFKEVLYTEIVVPPGQMTQIKLTDGSKIWLNSGSVFKYPNEFDQTAREVFIDGEAFMEITKDACNPFVVNTKNFSIEVLGTSFNISAYSADSCANLTLVEGSVLLRSEENKWENRTLVPGQTATLTNGEIPGISDVSTDFYTSWKEGKIVFRNETLEEIAKKMERWYNVEIGFKDEGLKSLLFSGTFLKYKPVDQVFKTLSIMNDTIDFVYENRIDKKNLIQITRKTN